MTASALCEEFFSLCKRGSTPLEALETCFGGSASLIEPGSALHKGLESFWVGSAKESFKKTSGVITYCVKVGEGVLKVDTAERFQWEDFDFVGEAYSRARSEAESRPLAGVNILAIDDCDLNRMSIKSALGVTGARVVVVGDPVVGLERLEGVDLLLVDFNMPGMTGLEFVQRLPAGLKAKRVLLTGYSVGKLARMPELEGHFDMIVTKGAGWEKLRESIIKLVSGEAVGQHIDSVISGEQLIDVDALRKRSDAKCLIERYVAQVPGTIAALRDAVGARNLTATFQVLHDIVGLAANLHANRLFLKARVLHDAVESVGATDIEGLVTVMDETTNKIIELRKVLDLSPGKETISDLRALVKKRSIKAYVVAREMLGSGHTTLKEVCELLERGKFQEADALLVAVEG